MRRQEPEHIGDLLRTLFNSNNMQSKLDERKAIDIWESVIGKYLAGQCRRPSVANGVMKVGISNSVVRNELFMNRSRLIREINDILGKEIIKEIKFFA